jgi:hypothetical protein
VLDFGQALFPIGVAAHGPPGSLEQSPTQFAAAFFADGFISVSPTAAKKVMEKRMPKLGICIR